MMNSVLLSLPPINQRVNQRRRITLKPIEKEKVLLAPAWCNSILNWKTICDQQKEFTTMLNKVEYHASPKHRRGKSY